MFRLVPIINPSVDWHEYLITVQSVMGRSATERFSKDWIELSHSMSDFLSTLKEVESPGSNLKAYPGALMDHIFYTFLVIVTNDLASKIISVSRLTCTDLGRTTREDFRLLIVSGTLTQYRNCVVNCCVDGLPLEVREFGTAILVHFKSIDQFSTGLVEIVKPDKTIKVIQGRQ